MSSVIDWRTYPSNKTVEFGEVKLFLLVSQASLGTVFIMLSVILFVLVLCYRKTFPIRVHNTAFLIIKCFMMIFSGVAIIFCNACPRYFSDFCGLEGNLAYQYAALFIPVFYMLPLAIKFWIIIVTWLINVQKLKLSDEKLNQQVQLKKLMKMKLIFSKVVPARASLY